MKEIVLHLTESQWTLLSASKAIESYYNADTMEDYCKNILLTIANSIMEPPVPEDLICPHCHEKTKFQMICEKCHKTFHQASLYED